MSRFQWHLRLVLHLKLMHLFEGTQLPHLQLQRSKNSLRLLHVFSKQQAKIYMSKKHSQKINRQGLVAPVSVGFWHEWCIEMFYKNTNTTKKSPLLHRLFSWNNPRTLMAPSLEIVATSWNLSDTAWGYKKAGCLDVEVTHQMRLILGWFCGNNWVSQVCRVQTTELMAALRIVALCDLEDQQGHEKL